MKTIKLFFGVLFCISVAACGGGSNDGEKDVHAETRQASMPPATIGSQAPKPPGEAPRAPYPRLLPLELVTPSTAQAGVPLAGVKIKLHNPGTEAPDARLRLIIHYKNFNQAGGRRELSPDNVKVEVLEGNSWKPVVLGIADGGVMGAIGTEGVAAHRERYKRGGFAIPAGLNKTWKLRVTFGLPGSYSLISAVSPDNGSRHLAQPAFSNIEVQ